MQTVFRHYKVVVVVVVVVVAAAAASSSSSSSINRVTVTSFLHISCFPPFCGASSAKCLLFWRQ